MATIIVPCVALFYVQNITEHSVNVLTDGNYFLWLFQPHPPVPLRLEREAAHKASFSKRLYRSEKFLNARVKEAKCSCKPSPPRRACPAKAGGEVDDSLN